MSAESKMFIDPHGRYCHHCFLVVLMGQEK
jgi:hypothetical protein